MPTLDDYLRISEAAEYVGVAPNTLRNWGRSGKLVERRHPINGYRLYAKDELDMLLAKISQPVDARPQSQKPR
jgi:DNA (cytosine-5)-methyltransferase 1